MSVIQQNLGKLNLIAGHPTAARTATGQTSGIDLRVYDGDVVFVLDSADNSSFAAIASGAVAFTQVTGTAAAQAVSVNKDDARRYVRIKYTIGGSSGQSFTFSVNAFGLKKYG